MHWYIIHTFHMMLTKYVTGLKTMPSFLGSIALSILKLELADMETAARDCTINQPSARWGSCSPKILSLFCCTDKRYIIFQRTSFKKRWSPTKPSNHQTSLSHCKTYCFSLQTILIQNIYRNPQNSAQTADASRCKLHICQKTLPVFKKWFSHKTTEMR